jgi:rhodanese-related sulfurtransferase
MIRLMNVLVIALGLMACQAQSSAEKLDTESVKTMAQEEDVFVVDVRTPGEVANGYIAVSDYFFDVNSADFNENIASLDKEKTYIVYCRSGVRSTNALNYMEKEGFTKLYELKGGILSWSDSTSISTE